MHERELQHRRISKTEHSQPIGRATIIRLIVRRILGSLIVIVAFGVIVSAINDAVIGTQRAQFVNERAFDSGAADVDDVRAWMTLRFVSVAYGVPESFLYKQLGIPQGPPDDVPVLGELNSSYGFGISTHGNYPAIVDKVQAAILAFRANPTPPGLAQIEPWMNIRYIARSSGVPESYLLEQLAIAAPGAATQLLTDLSVQSQYPGGVDGLIAALQQALATYSASDSVIVTQ